jgi:DNA-binding GntR family transcriptional regulator
MSKDNIKIIKTIKEQVYQILRNDIIEGKYAPGDKISEVEVASQLNVSRSPVHSAVNELIGEGLLVSHPNKPVRVKELTIKQILDIYEYRVLVENFSIKKIIENNDPKCFNDLLKFKERFNQLSDYSKIHQYILVDTQFHQFLVNCSGNNVVADGYHNYSIMITPFRVTSLISHERFKSSVREHTEIIDYILEHDIKKATEEDAIHLELAKNEIVKYLKNKQK